MSKVHPGAVSLVDFNQALAETLRNTPWPASITRRPALPTPLELNGHIRTAAAKLTDPRHAELLFALAVAFEILEQIGRPQPRTVWIMEEPASTAEYPSVYLSPEDAMQALEEAHTSWGNGCGIDARFWSPETGYNYASFDQEITGNLWCIKGIEVGAADPSATMHRQFAMLSWSADDVQFLRPEWTKAQAEAWLEQKSLQFQDALQKKGYNMLHTMINEGGLSL